MKKFLSFFLVLFVTVQSNILSQSPIVQQIIDSVNQDSLIFFVRELTGDMPTIINGTSQTIMSRYNFQPENELAKFYIKQKFESYGLNTTIQSYTSLGENVIATQPGIDFPNVKYIICAHYDDMPPGTIAPGADDNASGTVAVIEAARILSQYSFPITIIYAAWDQEELGMIGSAYYAQQAALAGDSILGVINLDMIGYDANNDNIAEIHVQPVNYSLFLKDKVLEINDKYSTGLTLYSVNPGVTNSDHSSFWQYNYSAIFLFEDSWEMNPNYHSVNDKVQYLNPSYYLKYVKLSLGTLADLSFGSIYGAIIAFQPCIDKTYARKNIDSVLFLTKFINNYNHPFTTNLIYSNEDNTVVDSIALYDDGMHGDSLSNDGIYGNYIQSQQNENIYSLDVSSIDDQSSKYFVTRDLCAFTTAGPVKLDSIRYVKDLFNRYNLKPFVTNHGEELTITNTKIKLVCNDPWVVSISKIPMNLPSMAPGASAAGASWATIEYNDTNFPGYFNIRVEIMRNGWVLWVDSTQVMITGVEENNSQVLSFNIEQNYPNPFNLSTTIKYSIPAVGTSLMKFVQLKVFNVLGKEVATLINEYKPVGKYEIDFNASALPSGVYFYQLKAGSFVSTKKMILLK